MKFLRDIWEGIWLGLLGPYVIGVLFMAYIALCFVFFDQVGLKDIEAQIFVGVAPFLALGFWAWKSGKIR